MARAPRRALHGLRRRTRISTWPNDAHRWNSRRAGSVVPAGLRFLFFLRLPAMNRWAIFMPSGRTAACPAVRLRATTALGSPTPTGSRNEAQGCRAAATLGCDARAHNPNGVAADPCCSSLAGLPERTAPQPLQGCRLLPLPFPRVGAHAPTLGFAPQARWACRRMPLLACPAVRPRQQPLATPRLAPPTPACTCRWCRWCHCPQTVRVVSSPRRSSPPRAINRATSRRQRREALSADSGTSQRKGASFSRTHKPERNFLPPRTVPPARPLRPPHPAIEEPLRSAARNRLQSRRARRHGPCPSPALNSEPRTRNPGPFRYTQPRSFIACATRSTATM